MIKCIIFDLGDVIVKNNPTRACRRLVKTCPLQHEETAWFAPRRVHKLIDLGRISGYELYKIAAGNLKLKDLTYKRFRQVFADIFTDNKPVQRLARKLGKNYALVLLSNTNAMHFNHLKKRFPVIKIFKHLVLSYRVGYVKPDVRIYREALKKSGFAARECVFIDNTKENVTGARNAGINAIQYTTTANLKKELKRLGAKF